jgi:hypothetical protein
MAIRLGEYVLYGEIRNVSHYSTHGALILRGALPEENTQIQLELTGDCNPDLHGKCFRFEPAGDDADVAIFDPKQLPGFQTMQVGPTGTMTAQGWVKVLPCSPEEFMRRAKLGEPPPTVWKDRLYLEWYGQNGRVVVEMAGAIVEEQVREPEGEDDEGEWQVLPNLAIPPHIAGGELSAEPEFILIRPDDIEAPPELIERYAQAEEEEEENPIRETELMDECLEKDDGVPVAGFLGSAAQLPPADSLEDPEIEGGLKALLAGLAMLGIAIDVCDHFTPRDCYRWLRDDVLAEMTVYPEMIGTGWVQHLSTWEDCPACKSECMEELEDFNPELDTGKPD